MHLLLRNSRVLLGLITNGCRGFFGSILQTPWISKGEALCIVAVNSRSSGTGLPDAGAFKAQPLGSRGFGLQACQARGLLSMAQRTSMQQPDTQLWGGAAKTLGWLCLLNSSTDQSLQLLQLSSLLFTASHLHLPVLASGMIPTYFTPLSLAS